MALTKKIGEEEKKESSSFNILGDVENPVEGGELP